MTPSTRKRQKTFSMEWDLRSFAVISTTMQIASLSVHVRGLVGSTLIPYAGTSRPIAWLWCRTAECPNPGCKTTTPLVSSLWLSKTEKSRAFLRIAKDDARSHRIAFDVIVGDPGEPRSPPLND